MAVHGAVSPHWLIRLAPDSALTIESDKDNMSYILVLRLKYLQ